MTVLTYLEKPESVIRRSDLLKTGLRMIRARKDAMILLHGLPRSGKSTLLKKLSEKLASEKAGDGTPFAPVLFDPSTLAGEPGLTRFRALQKAVISSGSEAGGETGPDGGCTVLLLVDEFEGEAEDEWKADFYTAVREMVDESDGKTVALCATGRAPEDARTVREALAGDIPTLRLAPLSHEETAFLVNQHTERSGRKWSADLPAVAHGFTGGLPFLTQHLFRVLDAELSKDEKAATETVQFRDLGAAFPLTIRAAQSDLESFWEGLAPEGRWLLFRLAEGGPGGIERADLHGEMVDGRWACLFDTAGGENGFPGVSEGIIVAEKARYRIGSDMLRRWVGAKKSVEMLTAEFTTAAKRPLQKARKAAEEGDTDAAISLLRRALCLSPDSAEAHRRMADLLIDAGRPDEARPHLAYLCDRGDEAAKKALVEMLFARARKSMSEETAIGLCEAVLDKSPTHAGAKTLLRELFIERGDRAAQAGDATGAVEHYRRAGAGDKIEALERTMTRAARRKARIQRSRRRLLRWGAAFLAFCLLLVGGGAFAVYAAYRHYAEDLPEINSVRDYQPPVLSAVYSTNHQKIAEFYTERRIMASLADIPERLIQAFISAEDARYFEHEGVDFIGIVRALMRNIEAGAIVQGGSTITQQVIKSLLLTPEKSYERKIKEAILAWRIEQSLSKREILSIYLNQIYLGNGAYGVRAAAENYFGKDIRDLNVAECAMLAGLTKSPGKDSPLVSPENAKARQRYVIKRMVEEGYITAKTAAEALKTPLRYARRPNYYSETAPYFSEYIRQYMEKRYGWSALYTDGLEIYTTVDLEMQRVAGEELEKGLADLEKRNRYAEGLKPEGALLCMEVGTGSVRAMVGGRDFDKSQFNRAIQSLRQPGSAFKPLIYAASLEKGFTPVTTLYDTPIVISTGDEIWKPSNYDDRFYGPMPLRRALAKSRNIPVIKVLREIGADYAVEYARKLGITSDLYAGLPLALGSSGVSLLELVNAYAVFANEGRGVAPVFITRILDRHGNEIPLDREPPAQVISTGSAFIMNSLLQSVVTEGTGYRVKKLGRPTAGKTGTTNDFRDAWFLGYTPEYITGVWVGFDQERPLGRSETGSKAASPVWLGFMERILTDRPIKEFPPPPEDVVRLKVDRVSGYRIAANAPGVYEWFKKDAPPRQPPAIPDYSPEQPSMVSNPEDFFKTNL